MRKIISLFLVLAFIIPLCGCSRETKMGIGEYSDRLNKDYGLILDENSMLLEKNGEENTVYFNISSYLFVLYLSNNNRIYKVAGILPKENEGSLTEFLDTYKKCVSVFTLNSEEAVKQVFTDCKMTADSIKFADGNSLFTVSKFKYSVVASELSVALFCERI